MIPMRALMLSTLLAVGTAPALSAPARAATPAPEEPRATTLNLQVVGEVKAAPDRASITVGVQTQAKTAAEALRLNRERMAATITALKAAGIEGKDIQTSALNLNGQYSYEPNQPPKLAGYQAVNQVTILVRDLTKLGPTVDAVTGAGANQISGIDFGLSDPKAAEDDARRQAVKLLTTRAELYAGAAGLRLGRLVNLTEGGGYQPAPMRRAEFADVRLKAAANTPIEPGELTVRVEVSAIYELVR